MANLAMIENKLFETSSFGKDFYFVNFFFGGEEIHFVPCALRNVDNVTLFFPCRRLRDKTS